MDVDAEPASRPLGDRSPDGPTGRRSDRWAAGGRATRAVWAWLAIGFALSGAATVAVVAAATAGISPFDRLPDRWAYVLFGAVPSLGVLALVTGLAARHGPRWRWLGWVAAGIGGALVLGAIAVVVILSVTLRSLG